MIDSRIKESLDKTTIKRVPNSPYAYTPFMNLDSLQACGLDVSNMSNKILIYDTRTYYFNLSTLIAIFGESDSKRVASNFMRTKEFHNLVEYNTNKLTDLPEEERKKYYNTPAYDKKLDMIHASYKENNKKHIPCCGGVFVHPSILLNALIWCNHLIAAELNTLVTIILLHQGVNEQKSIEPLVAAEVEELKQDASNKKEYIEKMKMHEELPKDDRFNKYIIYDQLHATTLPAAYKVTRPHRIAMKLRDCVNKQLILVRYFDEDQYVYDQEFPDDYPILFELHVVSPKCLNKFVADNTVKQVNKETSEVKIMRNAIPVSPALMSTFPYNDGNANENFKRLYGTDIEIESVDEKLSSYNISLLKDLLIDFTIDYVALDKF